MSVTKSNVWFTRVFFNHISEKLLCRSTSRYSRFTAKQTEKKPLIVILYINTRSSKRPCASPCLFRNPIRLITTVAQTANLAFFITLWVNDRVLQLVTFKHSEIRWEQSISSVPLSGTHELISTNGVIWKNKKGQIFLAEQCCIKVWVCFLLLFGGFWGEWLVGWVCLSVRLFFSAGMKMNSHSERQWKMKLIPCIKWLMMLT